MKKNILIYLIIAIVLAILPGCASSQIEQPTSEGNSVGFDADTQLIIGTLLLNGTENEVTADEATELLPLWQLYSALSISDTSAQEEIDAVVTQIQNTMTNAQIAAIGKIDLAGQNAMSLLRDNGLIEQFGADLSGNQGAGSALDIPEGLQVPQGEDGNINRPQTGDIPSGGRSAGGNTGGGFPGGGTGSGEGPGFAGMDPSAMATQMAESGRNAPVNRNSQVFLQLLFAYLEDKAAN